MYGKCGKTYTLYSYDKKIVSFFKTNSDLNLESKSELIYVKKQTITIYHIYYKPSTFSIQLRFYKKCAISEF